MEREKDAFYVVRKGGMIGIYKSFPDCLAQAGYSVSDPSVSVFKGYGLPRDAEDYLASLGLRNAAYSVSATDVQADLFGKLEPCRIQPPASNVGSSSKSSQETPTVHRCGIAIVEETSPNKYPKLQNYGSSNQVPTSSVSFSVSWLLQHAVLEYDLQDSVSYVSLRVYMPQQFHCGYCSEFSPWFLEFNSEADALANQAVQLRDGQVQEALITK
ncbi:unnamed protein product [Linum tenue]|uniref:Ribonuclease H1 N-terminal domain-containing protein n=1 Tax=Linum tenue TaxID=586396 RepID=A0AAV0NAZ4_9ROSI|nr:unnamed protein product [Linum tenue]